MRLPISLVLSAGLLLGACKKRRAEPAPVPEPTPAPAAEPVKKATPPPAQSTANLGPAPATVAQFEGGVEYADLNNVIAGFEFRNKRLPTIDELRRAYYGGTRPILVPPGHKLVIDPKTKKVKAVPGS